MLSTEELSRSWLPSSCLLSDSGPPLEMPWPFLGCDMADFVLNGCDVVDSLFVLTFSS